MPLQIIRQDITKMKVDAIVNTTNKNMTGYDGVDLDIHKAAGHFLDEECRKLAPFSKGEAKITKGYNLDCKYIIHTSGPVWHGGLFGEIAILKSCYLESLKLADEYGCESIAFPLISSGTYGFPKDRALKFATSVITEFLVNHEITVYLCVYDRQSYEFSKKLFAEIKDYIDGNTGYVKKKRPRKSGGKLFPVFNEKNAESFGAGLEDETFCMPDMDVEEKSLRSYATMQKRIEEDVSMLEAPMMAAASFETDSGNSLKDYMKDMDKPFAYKLFDLIDAKGMTDVECYKKANVDKKTFSKIKCNPNTYKPSKQTAVAFAIALQLDLDETQELLASAGMTLSRSFTFDKIIRFFIQKGNYNVFEINEALFEFDQVLLGC